MGVSLNTALIIVLARAPRLAADTLYRKRAVVAIGFGDSAQSSVSWSDCSHSKKRTYTNPPYRVDKGDDCKLHAELFGLKPSGQRYVADDVNKASLFFPDIKQGEFVDFSNDSADGLIELAYRVRSLRLPYAGLPLQSDIIWNELSVAEGFANISQDGPAKDLLQDSAEMLQQAPRAAFPANFIVDAAVSLFRIKPLSPQFSEVSHASLLQLAYLRSTLERVPEVQNRGYNPGCGISGEDVTITNEIYCFGRGSSCGLALMPGRNGRTPERVLVGNSLIEGGTHVLDGIQWDHDTFVGGRIHYRGGKILLNKVLVINCTFDAPDTPLEIVSLITPYRGFQSLPLRANWVSSFRRQKTPGPR